LEKPVRMRAGFFTGGFRQAKDLLLRCGDQSADAQHAP
jgi:hypothetical protein